MSQSVIRSIPNLSFYVAICAGRDAMWQRGASGYTESYTGQLLLGYSS